MWSQSIQSWSCQMWTVSQRLLKPSHPTLLKPASFFPEAVCFSLSYFNQQFFILIFLRISNRSAELISFPALPLPAQMPPISLTPDPIHDLFFSHSWGVCVCACACTSQSAFSVFAQQWLSVMLPSPATSVSTLRQTALFTAQRDLTVYFPSLKEPGDHRGRAAVCTPPPQTQA